LFEHTAIQQQLNGIAAEAEATVVTVVEVIVIVVEDSI
jgi:hypothetical protein